MRCESLTPSRGAVSFVAVLWATLGDIPKDYMTFKELVDQMPFWDSKRGIYGQSLMVHLVLDCLLEGAKKRIQHELTLPSSIK